MKNTNIQKESGMKASSLKNTLSVLLLVLIIGSVAGFYLSNNLLTEMAIKIKKENPTMTSNDSAMRATGTLKDYIAKNKTLSEKANLAISPQSTSQNQIMNDIKKHAADSSVKITDLSFNTSQTTGSSGGSYSIQQVNVTIESPVTYTNLIKFLKGIESNLPIMKLNGVSINSVDNTKVKIDPITIKFFTR